MNDRHMTDEAEISVAAWTRTFNRLKDSGWSDEDVNDFLDGKQYDYSGQLTALALKYAYDKIKQKDCRSAQEGVLATLKAVRIWRSSGTLFLTPADVCTMADHFVAVWDDFDQVIEDHLKEHYNDFPLHYVTEGGKRALTSVIRGDGEIWIDETNAPVNRNPLPGAWVFSNPDHVHH